MNFSERAAHIGVGFVKTLFDFSPTDIKSAGVYSVVNVIESAPSQDFVILLKRHSRGVFSVLIGTLPKGKYQMGQEIEVISVTSVMPTPGFLLGFGRNTEESSFATEFL